jgi:tRNA pseudouridine55 synthase
MQDGILNIDKPAGISSHEVIRILKRRIKIDKKVGHAGTLDPQATGVLPICIGKATKLIQFFEPDKEYFVQLKLGIKTDTYDIWGRVIKKSKVKFSFNLEDLNAVIRQFEGEIIQYPPLYSALHYQGKRLYELAKEGVELPTLPKRKVVIKKIKLIDYDSKNQLVYLQVKCGKGVYIRSLCNDIGEVLSTYGCLAYLRRLKSGCFSIKEAIPLHSINKDNIKSFLLNIDAGVMHLPAVKLSNKLKNLILNGRRIFYPIKNLGLVRLYDIESTFIGIGQTFIDKKTKKVIIQPKRIINS